MGWAEAAEVQNLGLLADYQVPQSRVFGVSVLLGRAQTAGPRTPLLPTVGTRRSQTSPSVEIAPASPGAQGAASAGAITWPAQNPQPQLHGKAPLTGLLSLAELRNIALKPFPTEVDSRADDIVDEEPPSRARLVNDDGVQVALGTDEIPGADGTGKFYCGRRLGVASIPGSSDGQCGPLGGPQCASCRRLQRTQGGMWDGLSSPGQLTPVALRFMVPRAESAPVGKAEASHAGREVQHSSFSSSRQAWRSDAGGPIVRPLSEPALSTVSPLGDVESTAGTPSSKQLRLSTPSGTESQRSFRRSTVASFKRPGSSFLISRQNTDSLAGGSRGTLRGGLGKPRASNPFVEMAADSKEGAQIKKRWLAEDKAYLQARTEDLKRERRFNERYGQTMFRDDDPPLKDSPKDGPKAAGARQPSAARALANSKAGTSSRALPLKAGRRSETQPCIKSIRSMQKTLSESFREVEVALKVQAEGNVPLSTALAAIEGTSKDWRAR